MEFFVQVLIYLVRFLLLAAVAVAGVFVGRAIRAGKDAKNEKKPE